MLGRSLIQDVPMPVRDPRSLFGASMLYEPAKSSPTRQLPQQPPPGIRPPWRGVPGGLTGGLTVSRRFAEVNIENMTPVIVVRQQPGLASGRHNQTGLMNRIRSSFALLPGAPGQ